MYNVQFVTFSQRRIARRGKFRSLSLFVLEQGRQKSMHEQVSFFVCRSVLTFIRLLYGCFFKYLRVFVACSFSKSFSKACFFKYLRLFLACTSLFSRTIVFVMGLFHTYNISLFLHMCRSFSKFNLHFF